MTKILRRLRYFLERGKMDSELAEEMELHRAMLADDGLPPAAMGNATLAREDARRVWIWPWLESLWQDSRYAVRNLRRQPGFTITALLALGSAIGVNTSLFTIFNAIALRPWPVREPSRVVMVHGFTAEGAGGFGIAEYRYAAQHSHAFAGLIAVRNGEQVKVDDQPLQLSYVSGNYFGLLGVEMQRGRGFLDQEDVTGAPQAVAVISHDLWQVRFGGDPQIVGRTIRMDDVPFAIIGVTSADFTGTNSLRNDIWTPLAAKKLLRPNDPSVERWLTSADFCCTPMAGRLAAGVTRTQAEAEVTILAGQFRTENRLATQRQRVVLSSTAWIDSPRKKRQMLPAMLTMFLAVTLVLLLACANVGNLLLARAGARRQEMAVRLSLGGSRARLIRQLLVESMFLALAAAGLGLAMTLVVPGAIFRRLASDQVYYVLPDQNVLVYTIAVAMLSCLAFGLAPALHGTQGRIFEALKSGLGGRTRLRLRSVLLSVQVAISVVLLANAGLLVHGFERARNLDPGFDVRNTSVIAIDLPASQYTGPRTRQLTQDLLAQLDRSPDLPPCGLARNPPLSNSTYSTSFQLSDRPGSRPLQIYFNEISGGYVDALGMRLLAGRNFDAGDTGRSVLIVNEAAARRWWPGESPLGKTVVANNQQRQIIGVISDAYGNDLASIEATLFFPITGQFGTPSVLVRDIGAGTLDRISAIVRQIEPQARLHAEPLSKTFSRRLQPSVYASEIASLLGMLALVIASVGMAGVFAYVVGQRTQEIGIRMALGAQASEIARLVLGSSGRALVWGVACGIGGAAGLSVLLANVLPGIEPLDPPAYLGVVVLLAAAVSLASAAPVRRATRVDPVRALRWE